MPLASGAEVQAFLRTFGGRREHAAAVREMTPAWKRRLLWTTVGAWVIVAGSLIGHTLADIAGWAYAEAFLGAVAVFSIATAIVLTNGLIAAGVWGAWRVESLAMERVGVCPSCLYELSGVPREGDGLVVCPECGAAWRVGDWRAMGGEGERA